MNGAEERDGWQRLHPLTPALRSVQLLYALVIGAFAASAGIGATVLLVVVAMAAIALWIALAYLRFRYRVTDESLLITHGVLFRQRRVIPRSRIQNVDLRAGLLQQLIGVVTARIETAGGQATEATLHVVSREEGARLRETLVMSMGPPAARAEVIAADGAAALEVSVQPPPAAAAETVVRRVAPLDLVIAGATANRAGLLVAALFGGDYAFEFMPTDWLLGRFLPPELVQPGAAVTALVETAQRDLQAFFTSLFVLSVFFGLAGWGLSVLASVVRYFDFTLLRRDGELQVRYGLLTRREKGFRRTRVQNVQIEESILRRWFKLAALRVQTAGYGPGVKADERMETLTPIVRRAELSAYTQQVYPDLDWGTVEWRPSHPRARRRLFIRRAIPVVLVTAVLLPLAREALILLTLLIPAWFLAGAHYRHLGHARSGPYTLTREGLWNRRTHIVPVRKIQALHFRQSPFQRRLGLGTLTLETAGSPYETQPPRSLDLASGYGVDLMEGLAREVSATGITF